MMTKELTDADIDQMIEHYESAKHVSQSGGGWKPAVAMRQLKELRAQAASKENQATISRWADSTFGPAGSNVGVAARANREMAELIYKLAVDDGDPAAIEECADVVIVLMRLADRNGRSLMQAIDEKMVVNRERKWKLDGNGNGQHVADEPAPSVSLQERKEFDAERHDSGGTQEPCGCESSDYVDGWNDAIDVMKGKQNQP